MSIYSSSSLLLSEFRTVSLSSDVIFSHFKVHMLVHLRPALRLVTKTSYTVLELFLCVKVFLGPKIFWGP